MSQFLEPKEYHCHVCGSQFEEAGAAYAPESLVPCGHEFCRCCVTLLKDGSAPCTLCGKPFTKTIVKIALGKFIADGKADAAAAAAGVDQEELLPQARNCKACASEEEVTPATFECKICGEKFCFCDVHAAAHTQIKKHAMKPLSSAAGALAPIVCPDHPSMTCLHFCLDCNKLVCSECCMYEHPTTSHNVQALDALQAYFVAHVSAFVAQVRVVKLLVWGNVFCLYVLVRASSLERAVVRPHVRSTGDASPSCRCDSRAPAPVL